MFLRVPALTVLLLLGACSAKHSQAPRTAATRARANGPEVFTLQDGRRMAVHHFGDPRGAPLLFFHGWPSDGSTGALLGDAARKHHLHIIAPDRPGIGLSDPLPHRTFGDWPADVRSIADHCGLKRFAGVGLSGGGPYALATAHAMPERVTSAAVVCGAPPLDDPRDAATLLSDFRTLLRIRRSFPGLMRLGFRAARMFMPFVPDSSLRPGLRKLPPADRAALADPRTAAILTGCARRSFMGSRDGVYDDAILYATPWGFDPAKIRIAVEFWHGAGDTSFPPTLARKLAARMPRAHLHIIPGEGHYSLPVNRGDAILAAIAAH